LHMTIIPILDFHIAIAIPTKELTYMPLKTIVINSIIMGIVLIILLVILMLSVTTRRVHRLLNAIRLSNTKLNQLKKH